jgi:RimJ/RimL family protein N-acetyltransferase
LLPQVAVEGFDDAARQKPPIVSSVTIEHVRVEIPRDEHALVEFLCSDVWPFHGHRQLVAAEVHEMDFASPNVLSFWIIDAGQTIGLIRLLDLGDIGEGAPQFDLRIASRHRGCGYGKDAVRWIAVHLFPRYPQLHRIEANTRDDNAAMQAVLSQAGFTCEGRLRQSWRDDEGHWFDTMIYGILRSDWIRCRS